MSRRALSDPQDLRVLLVDSITEVGPQDAGAIVVAASHGGTSSGGYALAVPLRAVFFNDAGIGKDEAGVAALAMLERHAVAAGAVSHLSARIGDVEDMWANGVLSRVNAPARREGVAPGATLHDAVRSLGAGVPVADGR